MKNRLANSSVFKMSAMLTASALTLAQVGCASSHDSSATGSPSADGTPSAAPAAIRLDGETLFRGIFFGEGAAAARLPELAGSGTPTASQVNVALAVDALRKGSVTYAKDGFQETADSLLRAANRLEASSTTTLELRPLSAEEIRTVHDAIVRAVSASEPQFFDTFASDIQSGEAPRVDRAIKAARAKIVSFGTDGHLVVTKAKVGDNGNIDQGVFVLVSVVLMLFVAITIAFPVVQPGEGSLGHDELVSKIAIRFATNFDATGAAH